MTANRRSYYRILHVQPEAPAQVITASYRTMMSKLRLHPDLGGDTDAAALINEAYAVLSDPGRRARYDAQLESKTAGRQADGTRQTGSASSAQAAAAQAAPAAGSTAWCPLCRASVPAQIRRETRCVRCESPLAPGPSLPKGKNELFGRRAIPRMTRSDTVKLIADWRQAPRSARLRDLSVSGISIVTDAKIAPQQVIRIVGDVFDVTALVVGSQVDGRQVEVHASLMTAIFTRPKGGVVSVEA